MDIQRRIDPAPISTSGNETSMLDLAEEAKELRRAETFMVHGHRSKTLTRNGDMTIVLMALRQGAHIREHRAEHATTLISLRGRIRVGLTKRTLELTTSQMLSLEARTEHDLEAVEDCDVLLVVGR